MAVAQWDLFSAEKKKQAAIDAERIRRNREESERREKARRDQQAANAATGTLATPKADESPEQAARNAAIAKEGEQSTLPLSSDFSAAVNLYTGVCSRAVVDQLTHAPEFSMEAYWEGEYSTVSLCTSPSPQADLAS
jgi:hypothetical protein